MGCYIGKCWGGVFVGYDVLFELFSCGCDFLDDGWFCSGGWVIGCNGWMMGFVGFMGGGLCCEVGLW